MVKFPSSLKPPKLMFTKRFTVTSPVISAVMFIVLILLSAIALFRAANVPTSAVVAGVDGVPPPPPPPPPPPVAILSGLVAKVESVTLLPLASFILPLPWTATAEYSTISSTTVPSSK